jgi:hypothetical protein
VSGSRGDNEPSCIDYPPVRVFRFSPAPFAAGIEALRLDGIPVRVYGREKTLADCFKYRTTIGLDTTLEAVRRYRQQGRVNVTRLLEFAQAWRVGRVIRPYLEALL